MHRAVPTPAARPPRRGAWFTAVAGAALLVACGGGGEPDAGATAESAAGQPRMRAMAAALNPAGWVAVPQRTDALMQGLTIPADAPTRGMWSRVGTWPINGLHQAVLPDGRVLTWGTDPSGNQQNGRYFVLWDPNRGLFDAGAFSTDYDPSRQDSFCAPAVYLPDGRLMITGGNGNLTNTTYTPSNGARDMAGPVADARWYATMLTLADGRPIVVGGINPYTEGQFNDVAGALARGESSMRPEVYENGAWRTLFGAESRAAWGPDFLRASMPKAWLAPDGRVFGISTDQMWYVDANANNGQGVTTIVGGWKGAPQAGATADTAPNAGPTSTGVMFAPGRVLVVGGNSYANGSGFPGSRQATVVDLNGGGAARTEQPLMAFQRNFGNVTVLPDGRVVATGGETRANNDPAFGVFPAEIWNPATGTWATMASSTVFRGYHSQASLLTNGTVLVSGGGTPGPVQLRGDVFYPPYLFRPAATGGAELAPRPRMIGLSGLQQLHGAQMQVDMAGTAPVSQLVLVGLSVGTHAFNSGQRRIPLAFTQDQFRLTATLPGNTLAPPGYYQLVAIDGAGVPSLGTVIAVGQGVPAPAVATTPYTPPDTGTGGGGTTTPPPGAISCAAENGTCTLPAGSTASVWYGADTRWNVRAGITGSIACNNATFGDPAPGAVKSCVYQVTSTTGGGGSGPAGALGAWTFDATAGTTAADSSGNNRTITLANATWVAGRSGQAAQFNGTTASGSTAGPVLDTAGSFSVSAWVRLDALTGWRTFVNQDGVNVSGFWLQFSEPLGSKFALTMHDVDSTASGAFRAVGTTTPVTGRWYHVTGVRDKAAGTMSLYVDGRLEGSASYAGGWASGGTLNVGRGRWGGPNDWFGGAIDDVRVYGRALTAAEVGSLFNGGTTAPPPPIPVINAPIIPAGGTASYTVAATAGVTYSWDFGDGSAPTPFSPTASATRVFASAGLYGVTLTARGSDGTLATRSFLQAVSAPATAGRPTASSPVALETRSGASARLWVANPDQDSVGVIDTATNARVAEVATGASPRSVAVAPDGRVWVVNKDAATVSIVSPATLAVVQTVTLAAGSRPHGLAFAPGGSAFVALEGTGELLKLDPVSGAVQARLAVGPNVRHVSASADGATVLVSRFITNPLPGEGTAVVDTTTAGAEVLAVNAGPMTLNRSIVLRHSDRVDNEIQGAGIPNYLAAAVISPDGRSAWVPSKQDNVKRGTLRNGRPLDFQNTVRAISSRIDMATLAEDGARRVDHDNSSLGSAAAYHPSGAYLFVALETSRQVAVVDPAGGRELLKVDVGRAPQGVAVSADGTRLYVQNFMDRTVSVLDLGPLTLGQLNVPVLAAPASRATERLAAQVLLGKQLFYDARDPRLSRDSYMSCASCHNDAGHDGRTWDLTHLGEGLRNTPALLGRGGMGQGFVHWSANFDEVQDFEGQIRSLAGGTGLMTDAQFNTGTRSAPLGDRKTGVSADLDALAAYLGSLSTFERSPLRNADGTLTAAAAAGRTVFANANCASCHGGAGFTISGDGGAMRNIGTIKPSSGQRLGAALTGLDVPTLRDVWKTAPYLHDGSAPTLAAAVQAHAGTSVSTTDLPNLVAYLQQIGGSEPAPGGPPVGTGTGLQGSYFGNTTLAGTAVVTRTEVPWFNWGTGAPAPGVAADNFSVRWRGEIQAVEGGSYQFRTLSDDGVRVWVNGVLLINNWTAHAPTTDTSAAITLAAGQRVPIVVEFQEFGGGAVLQLSWLRPGGAWAAVPVAQLYPAAAPANQPPTVTLTAPASAVQGSAIALAATAADADGSVARVEFYAGGTLLGSDTTAPYAFSWTGAAVGSYSVTARAFDNAGASTTSAAVNVTVTAAPTAQNIAPSATLATSYVSPWETLAAVNNNITPVNSADKNGGAYGNWQGEALYGRTDWVSFSWSSARTLSAFEVYWWNDGLGIATPTSARVEYWNGSAWVLLGSPGLALNTFNRLSFAPVTTTSIRVSMASTRATGILEARVFGF